MSDTPKTGEVLPDRVNALVPEDQTGTAVATMNPMALLRHAIDRGYDESRLEKLIGLVERWDAIEARKAFHAALADFRAENVEIFPNRKADFTNNKNQRVTWEYADIGEMMGAVNPVLGRHGLSLTWTARQDGGNIIVSAILSHAAGHGTEPVTLMAGPDQSGSKNSLQSLKSTRTSLMRQTGELVLGVAARGPEGGDDDGQSSEGPEIIDDEQAATLKGLARETGLPFSDPDPQRASFQKRFPYTNAIDELHASDFETALKLFTDRKAALAGRSGSPDPTTDLGLS